MHRPASTIVSHLIQQLLDLGWTVPTTMRQSPQEAALRATRRAQAGVPRHAEELIVPARDGTLRVLRVARAAGVQGVVMTSSVAAIAYGRAGGTHQFTEADWTDPTCPGLTPCVLSKTQPSAPRATGWRAKARA